MTKDNEICSAIPALRRPLVVSLYCCLSESCNLAVYSFCIRLCNALVRLFVKITHFVLRSNAINIKLFTKTNTKHDYLRSRR